MSHRVDRLHRGRPGPVVWSVLVTTSTKRVPCGSGVTAATGRPSRRGPRSHDDGWTYDQGRGVLKTSVASTEAYIRVDALTPRARRRAGHAASRLKAGASSTTLRGRPVPTPEQ